MLLKHLDIDFKPDKPDQKLNRLIKFLSTSLHSTFHSVGFLLGLYTVALRSTRLSLALANKMPIAILGLTFSSTAFRGEEILVVTPGLRTHSFTLA